jgi:hypothetical protein
MWRGWSVPKDPRGGVCAVVLEDVAVSAAGGGVCAVVLEDVVGSMAQGERARPYGPGAARDPISATPRTSS